MINQVFIIIFIINYEWLLLIINNLLLLPKHNFIMLLYII